MKLIMRLLTRFVIFPIIFIFLLVGASIGIGVMLILGASVSLGGLLKFYKQKPEEWT